MKQVLKKYQQVVNDIGVVTKDGRNPFAKSKYATLTNILRAVNPALEKNNLAFRIVKQETYKLDEPIIIRSKSEKEGQTKESETVLTTFYRFHTQMVDLDSGEILEDSFAIPFDTTHANPIQGYGSTSTYGQRYIYCMVFKIPLDDEDVDSGRTTGANAQKSTTTRTVKPELKLGHPKWESSIEWYCKEKDPKGAINFLKSKFTLPEESINELARRRGVYLKNQDSKVQEAEVIEDHELKPELKQGTKEFDRACNYMYNGGEMSALQEKYRIDGEVESLLVEQTNEGRKAELEGQTKINV